MIYALVFIGRIGEPFLCGIEIYALPNALEPLNDPNVDADLWALLWWMIAGVVGEWRVEDIDAAGRLYQLSVAARASAAAALGSFGGESRQFPREWPRERSHPTTGRTGAAGRSRARSSCKACLPALPDARRAEFDICSAILVAMAPAIGPRAYE